MMIDFVFDSDTAELRELCSSTRRFAEETFSDNQFHREHFNAMGELGLTAMSIDEKFGGLSMDSLSIASVLFELARIDLGPAIYLSVHLMVGKLLGKFANPDTHGSLLEKLASGEALGAFCLTEAQAGSDASALRTTATETSDGWELNGEKIYITSAGNADVYLVFARTSEDPKKGISAFCVTKDAPGLSVGPAEKKLGAHSSPIASVTFDSCRIPASAQIGATGEGYKIALSGLSGGRVSIGAAACGLASRSIEIARKHCQERKQFQQAIADFQGVQFMLADMCTKLYASVLLTRDAAMRIDRGEQTNWPSSMAKYFSSDAAMSITTDGVQLLGGAGYLADYTVERLMRDAKMLQIVEGTNQIQRMVVARELLQETA